MTGGSILAEESKGEGRTYRVMSPTPNIDEKRVICSYEELLGCSIFNTMGGA